MSRFIDVDKFEEKNAKVWEQLGKEDCYYSVGYILSQASVDAVEVIRCKNCKHFDRNEIGRREGGIYNICSEGRGMFLSGDDFCSWAKRIEE